MIGSRTIWRGRSRPHRPPCYVNRRGSSGSQGGRGPQTVTLVLKMDAGKLAGTLTGGRGGDVAITDVTLTGPTLKFKSKQMGRGGEIVPNWTGTVKGDEIAMSRMAEGGQGQAQEFTLKRQK